MTWIAVDWGVSHLRAWVHEGKYVIALRSDLGMGDLTPEQFEPTLIAMVEPHLDAGCVTTVMCCGMAGARQGWVEAPYISVPAAPPGAARAVRISGTDPRVAVYLLPGMSQAHPADVMRGEETQIAGFIAAHPEWDGVLCLPGSHAKWAHISAGEVVSFRTFMTGEMFALLSERSVLRHTVGQGGWDDAAFLAAVSDGMSRPERMAGALFSLRAEALLAGLEPSVARARLSGTLIGAELAAARPYWLGQNVVVLGDCALGDHYVTALAAQGVQAALVGAEEMTLLGLRDAYADLKES